MKLFRDDKEAGALTLYIAASRRNPDYRRVCNEITAAGHTVLDWQSAFRFDPDYRNWSIARYVDELANNPAASTQFRADRDKIARCDVLVMLMPAGRSAFCELGYAAALKKPTIVYFGGTTVDDPELMLKFADTFVTSIHELLACARRLVITGRRCEFCEPYLGRKGEYEDGDANSRCDVTTDLRVHHSHSRDDLEVLCAFHYLVRLVSETKCGLCDDYLVSDVSAIELVTTAVANNDGSTNSLDEQTILECEGYAEGVCNENLLCPDCAYRLSKD